MRILVLQHLAVEHPGLFRELWAAAGDSWDVVELDEGERPPALDDYDLLIAMGGPMDVWQDAELPWLVAEKALIRRWVRELNRPYLGICLGHQLLAAALDGEVAPMKQPEVGLCAAELTQAGVTDPLFSGLGAEIETFQWHGAEVTRVPEGGVVLARNAACPVQAMRVGRHAYGLQFHCEITASTVAEWQAVPAYAASLHAALGPAASALEQDVGSRLGAFATTAKQLAANLSAIVSDAEPHRR